MQHLVSKGYQRNFADGVWVSIIDAESGAVLEARKSIKTNWRLPEFLSVTWSESNVDDALEREFADQERVVLNRVRDISISKETSEEQKSALDLLAAIHLVRSEAFREKQASVAKDWLSTGALKLTDDPRLLVRFVAQYRRQPAAGELEAMVREQAEAMSSAPDLHADGVRRGAARLHELFGSWRIQLIDIDQRLPGLVLADNPILHGSKVAGRFGFDAAGAVGDAEIILVPIQRRLAACYSPMRLPNITIQTKAGLGWINALLIRGASAEVACHPDDALAISRLIRNLDRYPPRLFDQARLR